MTGDRRGIATGVDGREPGEAVAFDADAVARFRYVGCQFDLAAGTLRSTYALDELLFEEVVAFSPPTRDVDVEAVERAARLVYLLSGVSYYKAAAPRVIDVDPPGLSSAERRLLEATYLDGLGEYAFRNSLDLTGVRIVADERPAVTRASATSGSVPAGGRLLVPFGGGIDSIVTVEGVRSTAVDAALFVVSKAGDRFEAIETAAAVTGLPVRRAERRLDDKVLRSRELGFRNGHVPVTGILSAIAVTAALLDGRDAVVMSNEWSASSGNLEHGGRPVNHQWSKSLEFEELFRAALLETLPAPVDYFSWLRPFSELWVAERFAGLSHYHRTFRSCNRAFHLDPAERLDHWCGRCDKCCFIDLILSPFLSAAELDAVFGGNEPLGNADLLPTLHTLVGTSGDAKPFECVGDVDECRVATLLAAERPDRAAYPVLQALARDVQPFVPGDVHRHADRLRRPLGPHRIPDLHAPLDLLG